MVVVEFRKLGNRHYVKGRSFEYKVRNYLLDRGYWVIRAAGSKGCADLVALAPAHYTHRILLVSCKTTGIVPSIEKNELYTTAVRVDALPIIAEPQPLKGSEIKFSRLREHKVCGLTELLASPIDI